MGTPCIDATYYLVSTSNTDNKPKFCLLSLLGSPLNEWDARTAQTPSATARAKSGMQQCDSAQKQRESSHSLVSTHYIEESTFLTAGKKQLHQNTTLREQVSHTSKESPWQRDRIHARTFQPAILSAVKGIARTVSDPPTAHSGLAMTKLCAFAASFSSIPPGSGT